MEVPEALMGANHINHLTERLPGGFSLELYGKFNGVTRYPNALDVKGLQSVLHEAWTTEEGHVLYAHPELFDFANWTETNGQEGHVHEALRNGTMHVVAVKNDAGEIVATAALVGSELGRVAARKDSGKGHGKEAIKAVLEIGRGLGLSSITVDAAGIRNSMEYALRQIADEIAYTIVPTYMDPAVWGGQNGQEILQWGCFGFAAIPQERLAEGSLRIPFGLYRDSQIEQVLGAIVEQNTHALQRKSADVHTPVLHKAQEIKPGLFYVAYTDAKTVRNLQKKGYMCCGFHTERVNGEDVVMLHLTDLPLQPLAHGVNRRLGQDNGGYMYTTNPQTAQFAENILALGKK